MRRDLTRDYRNELRDRIEEAAQEAYDAAYARIADQLIAEAIEQGADADYRPRGAEIHRLVLDELKRGKRDD